MRLTFVGAVLSALVFTVAIAPEATAQRRDRGQDWVQLGCQQVSFSQMRSTFLRSSQRTDAQSTFLPAGARPDAIGGRRRCHASERITPVATRDRSATLKPM